MVKHWFGDVKEFPDVELLSQTVGSGAPVAVSGERDLLATL